MKKELSTGFNSRQYMQDGDFEIFYYNDSTPAHVSSHRHDYYEFYFFLEGDVNYEIAKVSHSLVYGDCLLIPPGISHRPVFLSAQAPYRRFVLWISAARYDQLCNTCPDFSYAFDHVLKKQQYHFRSDFIQFQQIQGLLMELIEEYRGSHAFRSLSLNLKLCNFLLHMNRLLYDRCHQVAPTYSNVLYLNVCDYINNHLEEDLSLDFLASFFYVSKYHISHIFKDNMGISLHQYVLKKRLQACKNGILSGIPFNEIFQQYGFSDYSSFYRAFKKEFGLSPTEFREQHTLAEDGANPFV